MAVRKESWGWIVDFWMRYPDGGKERIREKSPIQTRRGAEAFERDRRDELMEVYKQIKLGLVERPKKEVPTFSKWWDGRFWRERVVGERNSESEKEAKKSIYDNYLEDRFGDLPLDEIVNNGFPILRRLKPNDWFNVCRRVLRIAVSPSAVIANGEPFCFLLFPHGGQLFRCAKAAIGFARGK